MANPLFNQFGNQPMPGQLGELADMVQNIRQFASTLNGDPREIIQQKLNSGEMTQQQYNEYMQIARQIAPMMK